MHHQISLMCDDIHATVAELAAVGVARSRGGRAARADRRMIRAAGLVTPLVAVVVVLLILAALRLLSFGTP